MPEIRLTYWWNGHEPGDVVDVDEVTARNLLSAIAEPVRAEKAASRAKADTPKESAEKTGD
jgi:hypothetical protein